MGVQMTCNFLLMTLLLSFLILGISKAEDATFPILKIHQGTLQGVTMLSRHNRSFFAFRGVPFGQPPIGNLRFSSPVAAGAWNGTLDATVDRKQCTQPGDIGEEDCLYLNVYTPQLPKSNDSSLLSVMVYIPGGGFESGNGGSTMYGPGYLLDADVVLVSVNYRLGPLGFLSTGDEVAPGNWGLKDQVLALQWVQKNIAYFGGDPDQVTIFGKSGGAMSVQVLALSESTVGLFHKSISQSGASLVTWVYPSGSSYTNLALRLGEYLGCPTNSSSILIDCLREIDAAKIISTRSLFNEWDRYPGVIWGPTVEPNVNGALITDSPANLLATGKIRDLPSMAGVVKDEGTVFIPGVRGDPEAFQKFLDDFDHLLPIVLQYSDRVDDVPSFTAALKKFYFDNNLTTNQTQVWNKFGELATDIFFFYPAYKAIQSQYAFAKSATFFYSFEYRGRHSFSELYTLARSVLDDKVFHGDDLLYLFPILQNMIGISLEEMSRADLQMIDTVVQLWTSFAINGTPTITAAISNTTWLPYSSGDNYLRIGSGSNATLDMQSNFFQERMQFWDKLTATGSGNIANICLSLRLIFVLLIAYSKVFS